MDKKFIINLQGKEFITFEGLLAEFHKNEGKSIETEETANSTEDSPKFKAIVEGKNGKFTGHGDANSSNVNTMIAKHKYRMAETRAIARALRWYNNIGMCSVDELGGENNSLNKATQVPPQVLKPQSVPLEQEYVEVANTPTQQVVNKLNNYKKPVAGDKCQKCGAEMKISKAGKPYCSALCWKG